MHYAIVVFDLYKLRYFIQSSNSTILPLKDYKKPERYSSTRLRFHGLRSSINRYRFSACRNLNKLKCSCNQSQTPVKETRLTENRLRFPKSSWLRLRLPIPLNITISLNFNLTTENSIATNKY